MRTDGTVKVLDFGLAKLADSAATTPTTLLKDGSVFAPAGNFGRAYDVSPDAQRFLVAKPVNASNAPPPQLIVVSTSTRC